MLSTMGQTGNVTRLVHVIEYFLYFRSSAVGIYNQGYLRHLSHLFLLWPHLHVPQYSTRLSTLLLKNSLRIVQVCNLECALATLPIDYTLISSTIMRSQISHSRREGVCKGEVGRGERESMHFSRRSQRLLISVPCQKRAMDEGKK